MSLPVFGRSQAQTATSLRQQAANVTPSPTTSASTNTSRLIGSGPGEPFYIRPSVSNSTQQPSNTNSAPTAVNNATTTPTTVTGGEMAFAPATPATGNESGGAVRTTEEIVDEIIFLPTFDRSPPAFQWFLVFTTLWLGVILILAFTWIHTTQTKRARTFYGSLSPATRNAVGNAMSHFSPVALRDPF